MPFLDRANGRWRNSLREEPFLHSNGPFSFFFCEKYTPLSFLSFISEDHRLALLLLTATRLSTYSAVFLFHCPSYSINPSFFSPFIGDAATPFSITRTFQFLRARRTVLLFSLGLWPVIVFPPLVLLAPGLVFFSRANAPILEKPPIVYKATF